MDDKTSASEQFFAQTNSLQATRRQTTNPLHSGASGFIFDCDGTLLDTMGAWNALEEDLFAQASMPFSAEELDQVRALPIQHSAALFHEHGIGKSPEHVLDMLDTALLGFYQSEAQPKPGAVEFVQAARAAGIPCVVVSSSPVRYVEAGLRRAGILNCFVELVTTEAVGMSKQDPGIYDYAIGALGSVRETTWCFDDALYAICAMRDAGLKTCACYDYDEVGTFAQLQAAATLAIRSFTELL